MEVTDKVGYGLNRTKNKIIVIDTCNGSQINDKLIRFGTVSEQKKFIAIICFNVHSNSSDIYQESGRYFKELDCSRR